MTATGNPEMLLCERVQRPAEALCTVESFAGSSAYLTNQASAGEGLSRPQTAWVSGRRCQSQQVSTILLQCQESFLKKRQSWSTASAEVPS